MSTETSKDPTLNDLITSVGLNQVQFASLLGVSRRSIAFWGKGESVPSLAISLKAAKILNCSIERFAMACKISISSDDDTDTDTDITV